MTTGDVTDSALVSLSISLLLRNYAEEPDQWWNRTDAPRRAACDCK
jgi:hypothetical protein